MALLQSHNLNIKNNHKRARHAKLHFFKILYYLIKDLAPHPPTTPLLGAIDFVRIAANNLLIKYFFKILGPIVWSAKLEIKILVPLYF